MKDITMIICDYKNYSHSVGNYTYCCNCNKQIWLAESTINAAVNNHKNNLIIMCINCAMNEINKHDEKPKFMLPTTEQLEELKLIINNQHN